MLIAKNDEAKRSRLWRIVLTISSVLIIVIAAFFLFRMFTSNPLEGKWVSQDSGLVLDIKRSSTVAVEIPEVQEETNVKLNMDYVLDKDGKTITIKENPDAISKSVKKSNGAYTEETLRNALSSITTTFSYSVENQQLMLTEREYGEQMIFDKQ